MKRILISGYYGFDNAGDEAVLAGLISSIRGKSQDQPVELTALSVNTRSTSALHGIRSKHRYKQLLHSIIGTDLLLSGGGSLLQDVTSAHGIFYYLAVVRIAQILGKKTMFVAQGIGPLVRRRSQKLTAAVANRLDAITVRDSSSDNLLKSIGVTRPIVVTSDPALLLAPSSVQTRSGILLSMRQWPDMPLSFNGNLAAALVQTSLGLHTCAINMHGESDRMAAAGVLRLLDKPREDRSASDLYDFQSIFDRICAAEMVVGMRLHALIFAAASGVPSVALSYDPKVDAFMQLTDQSNALIDINSTTLQEMTETITTIWQNRSMQSEKIRAAMPDLRRLAMENAVIALNLLKN
jgi:polysaccharide pyruvyl transferase CsaB